MYIDTVFRVHCLFAHLLIVVLFLAVIIIIANSVGDMSRVVSTSY
jgi:hypothetical protein